MASAREAPPARILVVDYDEDMPVVVRLALESGGHFVTLAESGLWVTFLD